MQNDPALFKLRHNVRAAARAYDRAAGTLREALRASLNAQIAYHEALKSQADQKRLARLRAHLALTYRHPTSTPLPRLAKPVETPSEGS